MRFLVVVSLFALVNAAQVPFMDSLENEDSAIQFADFDLSESRLIHVFGEDMPRVVLESDKLNLPKKNQAFMDITDQPSFTSTKYPQSNFKQSPPSLDSIPAWIHSLDNTRDDAIENMKKDLWKLTRFWTRSYKSLWGKMSSEWLTKHIREILKYIESETDIMYSITEFKHSFPQSSIIVRLEKNTITREEKEIIIIGAHQDSLNYDKPWFRAPGADDDGSGSVVLMQILRYLILNEFTPPMDTAIEFHWYAGEEGGLLGSIDVAAAYREVNKPVKAMLQLDATAVVAPGTNPVIAFFDQNTNKNLTSFGTHLVDEYNSIPWVLSNCGVKCGSDHMSWDKMGYPAMFAMESPFNLSVPFHTIHDHMSQPGFNLTHAFEFVKLGTAYILEAAFSF